MPKQTQSTHVENKTDGRQAQHDAEDDRDLAQEQLNEQQDQGRVRRTRGRTVDADGGEESVHGRKQKGTIIDS